MKTVDASIMILALLLALSIVSVSALTNVGFGGKSGDWIEYLLQETPGSAVEQLERMDFLNVAGTAVTARATFYMGSSPMNITKTIDLTSQDDFLMPLFSARVYFIPGGLSINDSVYLGEVFGTRTIDGETTRNYAGVDRRVIYANFSEQASNCIFYWDRQTGVLTEGTESLGIASRAVLITGTSMWGTEIWLLLWIIIIIVVALGVLSSRKNIVKKLRRKRDTQPASTKATFFPPASYEGKVIETRGFI
jgi:hypothetical protein